MEIKNETQHKMKCSTGMIHSYVLRAKMVSYLVTRISYLILLSITIGSCYSIVSDCNDGGGDFYWEYTGGPPGVNPYAITVASNGNIWVSANSSIYLSADNGNTWVEKGRFSSRPLTISINPMNNYIFTCIAYNGLFRSTDNGENWEKILDIYVSHILITASGEIYLRAMEDIYYSTDHGDTWIEKKNRLTFASAPHTFALGKDGTLYVGTGRSAKGVYHSTDGGNNWLPSSNYTDVNISNIIIADDGLIFAVAGENRILKSTDKSITWTDVSNGIGQVYMGYAFIYNPIAIDIFVSANSWDPVIYRSIDLGASWQLTNSGIADSLFIQNFAFNSNTGQMYLTAFDYNGIGGVYRSKNYP